MNPLVVPCLLAGLPIGIVFRRLPQSIKNALLLLMLLPLLALDILPEGIGSHLPDPALGIFVFLGWMVGAYIEIAATALLKKLREARNRQERILAGEEGYDSAATARSKAEAWADWWAIGISIVVFLALEVVPFSIVSEFENRSGFFAHVAWLILSGIVFLIARAIHSVIHTIALSQGIRRYSVPEAAEIERLKSEIHFLSVQLEELGQNRPRGNQRK
jgi:hypothetical protein